MIVLIALSGCAAQDRAQDRGAPEGVAPAGTEVESHLYSAELVLDHQTAIGLTDAQRAARSSSDRSPRSSTPRSSCGPTARPSPGSWPLRV